MLYQLFALLILLVFYAVYLGKMVAQRKKGIKTDQMARGKKPAQLVIIESLMKVATYSVVFVEIISIAANTSALPPLCRVIGLLLGAAGSTVFAIAVWTMRDSWRAGIAQQDKTEMVTTGIYHYSRNPAFLGFDLVYIGMALTFFNWVLLAFTLFAIVMLHLQILQEEAFLPGIFREQYLRYKAKTRRYLGRR